MNWKNRLTNYNFWISIVSAVLLIFQAFHLEFDIAYINEIVTAVLGLLVVVGIISDPTKVKQAKTEQKTDAETSDKTSVEIETIPTELAEQNALENATQNLEEGKRAVENGNNTNEEKDFPIDNENEDNDDISQNDYETLIKQISIDLNDKFNKLYAQMKNQPSAETPDETPTEQNSAEDVNISAEIQKISTDEENISELSSDYLINQPEVEIQPTDNSHPIVG